MREKQYKREREDVFRKMGKRLQERTKDEKKQWHVVNHLTSVFGTSFYISLLQLMYD